MKKYKLLHLYFNSELCIAHTMFVECHMEKYTNTTSYFKERFLYKLYFGNVFIADNTISLESSFFVEVMFVCLFCIYLTLMTCFCR